MDYEASDKACVIQPSSVPVDRRMRRAKSDGINTSIGSLLAWLRGELHACVRWCRYPDEADEDARRCVRERTELHLRARRSNQSMELLLATLGVSDYNRVCSAAGIVSLTELRTGLASHCRGTRRLANSRTKSSDPGRRDRAAPVPSGAYLHGGPGFARFERLGLRIGRLRRSRFLR